jgi:hypothetical protein
MAWLRIATDPEMGFFDRVGEETAGELTDNAWKRLEGISPWRRPLGPGGEAANVTASIENGDGSLTELLLGDPPLGVRAEVGEGDVLIAAGAITRITGGTTITISIEGGA